MKPDITAYYQRVRLWKPTGVGKHILHMTAGLEHTLGGITHLQEFDDLRKSRKLDVAPVQSPSTQRVLPIPRRALKATWLQCDFPPVELLGVKADWFYCPAEDYVATRYAKLAVTIHDTRPFETALPWSNTAEAVAYRKRWQPVLRKIAQRADVLLTVSEYSKARMIDVLGLQENRIVVVGNGVEDFFYATRASQHEVESPFILMVGGLQPRKGHSHVMRLADLLLGSKSNIRICVAGKGEPDCEAEASSRSNVELLGYVSDDQLCSLMSRATVFMMLSEYEGFGIPVLEAMAAKCPVIAINKSSLPEVVGGCGILVTNADDAFEATLDLIVNPTLRGSLIEKGSLRAEDFRWSSCVHRLMRALRLS